MSKSRIIAAVLACLVLYTVLLVSANNSQLTVIRTERVITDESDINNRDCHVTVKTTQGQTQEVLAESSLCTSLDKGDVVSVENGVIQ
jgi:hypothetical protein